ncbi:MAG: AzlC family ABC transporter permease [Ilumatobacteraceae bacterium]
MISFSATSQLAFVAVRAAEGTVVAALVSGWLVASRFGVLSITLSNRLRVRPWERAAAALTAVDPSVALAIQQPSADRVRAVYWRITAFLVVSYLSGITTGLVLGSVIGDIRVWGLDVVFPAALLSIISGMLRRRDGAATAAVAAVVCVVLIPLTPGGVPILGSLLGLLVGLRLRPTAIATGPG